MLHQRDVLVAALQSRGAPADFDVELTNLYGSAFTLLSSDPAPNERPRREWEPVATASSQKTRSQVEQRVVDTTLREMLRAVHGIPIANKRGWETLADNITAHSSWHAVASQLRAASGGNDEASGFFWASMIAAAMTALDKGLATPTSTQIASYMTGTTVVFDRAQYPRGASGNSVKIISEMRNSTAVRLAVDVIAAALSASSLPISEKRTVVAVVGAVVSADLWRHPCGVYWLLLPSVRILRGTYRASFSLDSSARSIEQIIDEELGDNWRLRGVW